MSSLAASRADNFYFPPDWRPEYGGISKFQGSKGANQYQTHGIIRFELPFDGWCLKCKRHISKGTRYNAKKNEDGKYFTTKIWAFTMKCASCDQEFLIKTNPAESTYDFVQGIRKMEQEFTPEYDDSIIQPVSEEDKQNMIINPIFKLQHDVEDHTKAQIMNERVSSIMEKQEIQYQDDYSNNVDLRKKLRMKKKKDLASLNEGRKYGLNLPLVDMSSEDIQQAQIEFQNAKRSKLDHKSLSSKYRQNEKMKLLTIQSSSIFDTKKDVLGHKSRHKLDSSKKDKGDTNRSSFEDTGSNHNNYNTRMNNIDNCHSKKKEKRHNSITASSSRSTLISHQSKNVNELTKIQHATYNQMSRNIQVHRANTDNEIPYQSTIISSTDNNTNHYHHIFCKNRSHVNHSNSSNNDDIKIGNLSDDPSNQKKEEKKVVYDIMNTLLQYDSDF